jgi:hypothetical protein
MTYRHDYGLDYITTDFPFASGMTDSERKVLWNQMAQIFDNDILSYMTYREDDNWK